MNQAQGIFGQVPTRADRIDNVVWGQWEKGRNDGGVGGNGRMRRRIVGKGSFEEGTIGTYCQQGKEQSRAAYLLAHAWGAAREPTNVGGAEASNALKVLGQGSHLGGGAAELMRPNGQGGAQGAWSSHAVPAVMLAMMRLVIYELDEGANSLQSHFTMVPSKCLLELN